MTATQISVLILAAVAIILTAWTARLEIIISQSPAAIIVVDRWRSTVQSCNLQACGRIYPH